jgi:hypothetical protein
MKKKNTAIKVLLIIAIVILLPFAGIITFTHRYAPGPDDSINGKWRLVQMGPSLDEMKDLPRNFMEMTISDGSFDEVVFEKDGSIRPDSTSHGSIKKNLLGEYSRTMSEWEEANIIVRIITSVIYEPDDIRKEGSDRIVIHTSNVDCYLCYERIEG